MDGENQKKKTIKTNFNLFQVLSFAIFNLKS
jgi:hypothetical protein